MRLSHFFIDRPIFALVIAVFITLIGLFAYPRLPLAQYPDIAPPTVNVSATYAGATAEDAALQVAEPLEEQINGTEHMIYMESSSTSAGQISITVSFAPGTNVDIAQVLVQNAVNRATPRLPNIVRQSGVTVNKQTPGFLVVFALYADDPTFDADYVSNYANTRVRDELLRVDGVGAVSVAGGGNYAMRIWIDPDKAAARNLNASDITNALAAQNVQAVSGSAGAPPFGSGFPQMEIGVVSQGRLETPAQFADIVIKRSDQGELTRLGDVARVEIGQDNYTIRAYFAGHRGVGLLVSQQPGANELATARRVRDAMETASKTFPQGLKYTVAYNPVQFVEASVDEVERTLFEAVGLVVLVIMIFLQTWRTAIIPIVVIPVALVGVFAVQAALGLTINSLSLFGLVLAIGIVVDDAIVVIENVERHVRAGASPRQAARDSMDEVAGALVAIGLVLVSVFVPTAFTPGIPGVFYRQFAVAIAASTVISLLMSLTLTPAMAALLLRPHKEKGEGDAARKRGPMALLGAAGDRFNRGFQALSDRYGRLTARLVRMVGIMLLLYAGLIALTGWRLLKTPTGFIPDQDQGALIGVVQLPPGASVGRTEDIMLRAREMLREEPSVDQITLLAGLDGSSFSPASNTGTFFIILKDYSERRSPARSAARLTQSLTRKLSVIPDASFHFVSPPTVRGLGTGNGFTMIIEDLQDQGYPALQSVTQAMVAAAAKEPTVTQVFTVFNTTTPRLNVDVDRSRALQAGVQPSDIFDTLGIYLGSLYVDDFNYLGRTFRVIAQADYPYRDDPSDAGKLQVRNSMGGMSPIDSVANLSTTAGAARVVRYNLLPAVELQGQSPPGVSSGQSLATMERLAAQVLPPGFTYEWTTLAFQEKAAAGSGAIIFLMAVVFVYLVLAAQYEAFTLPLAVILIVPMCVLAAMIGINLRGLDNNILTQVGLIVLIALAAKNAILIVEFARQNEEHGDAPREAAADAARTRLRPILMTSIAFILGVFPLVISTGPGAEMRRALGTAVFFGMIGVTSFGLLFTPVFYVVMRWVSHFLPKRAGQGGARRP
jgi:hydrophobe/amphiphile efflux-1 (HAE1) family protein